MNVSDAAKIYGEDEASALTGAVTGVLNNDPIFVSFSSTGAAAAAEVGAYGIDGILSDGGTGKLNNYIVTMNPGTLTVQPAPLTVTANNASRVYRAANPAFTASYAGFVLGQGPGVLGGTLAFSTTATAASPVGVYAIAPGGLSAANYTVGFINGTLPSVLFSASSAS